MKRIYDVPPSYSGSRFIRATHGVRALSDGELSAKGRDAGSQGKSREGARPERRTDRRAIGEGTPRPDFEYFGNPTGGSSGSSSVGNLTGAGRRPPQLPAHPTDGGIGASESAQPDDRPEATESPAAKQRRRARPESNVRVPRHPPRDPHGPELPHFPEAPHRPDGPHGAGNPPHPGSPHFPGSSHRAGAENPFGLSAEDGDLLLLALLALLAGEDGCADVAAALALLLAVR